MAVTAITSYADGLEANLTPLYAPLAPNLSAGRIRAQHFYWTCASEASGASIAACILPKGARLLYGELVANGALSTSATLAVGLKSADGSGEIDYGTVGSLSPAGVINSNGVAIADLTDCLKAAAILSTTIVPFCLTLALGYGYELQKECFLTLTIGTHAVATEVVRGTVYYVVD